MLVQTINFTLFIKKGCTYTLRYYLERTMQLENEYMKMKNHENKKFASAVTDRHKW